MNTKSVSVNTESVETVNYLLSKLIEALRDIPETDKPGYSAYYLNRLVNLAANQGLDEPMVASFWYQEDFETVLEEWERKPCQMDRQRAQALFAMIDRKHNAEIGINWDVLKCALEEV